jgi:hypothetical protein
MTVHTVDVTVIHHPPQVKCKGTQSSVVRVREAVDDSVKRVTAERVIVLFGSSDEAVMVLESKQWVRKITEKLLQQASNTVDVMVKVLGVPKVESRVGRLCIEHVLELLDVCHGARLTVDTLHVKTVHINRLDALINNHGNSQTIALVEAAQW